MVMKAQIYSLIVVLIVIPLFMFISLYIRSAQTIKSGGLEKIVADQEYLMMKNIEDDFSRAVEISGKRAILAAINDVINRGAYLENSTLSITEMMINGTLHGNLSFIMIDNTLDEWKNNILEISTEFYTYLSCHDLVIENHNGIKIKATVNMSINVSDNLNISEISKNIRKDILVSFDGFEDPLFPMETLGFLERKIDIYPYTFYAKKIVTGTSSGNCSGPVTFDNTTADPEKILVTYDASGISGYMGVIAETGGIPSASCYVIGATDAVSEISSVVNQTGYQTIYIDSVTSAAWSLPIKEGIENGYYYYSNGPTMLERLEGNFSGGNPNGTETFVIIPDLQALGMEIKDQQTRIAYLYFSSQSLNGQQVRGLPEWFRIDSEHADNYNLTELLMS